MLSVCREFGELWSQRWIYGLVKIPITMVHSVPLEWHFCLWALCLHAQLVFHSGIALNIEKSVVDKLRRTCIVFFWMIT